VQSQNPSSASRGLLPPEIRELGPEELLVNECFASIQGESSFAGWPCFFIRLAGCHLRCSYCDTEYAFFEGRRETVAGCIERARQAGLRLVEVTGGEPLLQRAVLPLLVGLCDAGFEVLLETSGAVEFLRVDPRVRKIVDVKCPSSGMADRNLAGVAAMLRPGDELKFVLGGREDFDWARRWLAAEGAALPPGLPVHFSPVHGALAPEALAAWILEHRLPVRLNLQLHKLLWPAEARGV
jgi:7-carboxy-7-deazaguanine synthase